eukprot:CAMPEP_0172572814 /NCGR_PEP_ID=MMETSP1067-20121228/135868_1 /TAXON_ID=265564 ORGANISM="Thalassiosira punctigera, Strain Tpunct2005C2" /NCGR_SAMPLE_ID=MMETSP1067 /ASSEMBLY_ACC=CAM_ASM_000444 /LENGTH=224 /DNA_ID=CAMNT_0013365405 /DNA_START=653 /DNA_END=1327 /DNA_ORIENTATION=+
MIKRIFHLVVARTSEPPSLLRHFLPPPAPPGAAHAGTPTSRRGFVPRAPAQSAYALGESGPIAAGRFGRHGGGRDEGGARGGTSPNQERKFYLRRHHLAAPWRAPPEPLRFCGPHAHPIEWDESGMNPTGSKGGTAGGRRTRRGRGGAVSNNNSRRHHDQGWRRTSRDGTATTKGGRVRRREGSGTKPAAVQGCDDPAGIGAPRQTDLPASSPTISERLRPGYK